VAHLLLKDTVLSDRRLPLPGKVVVLGRSIDADVPIPHRSISRRHALVECSARGYAISDLGSRNGTWIGERKLVDGERAAIEIGGSFRVGEVAIVLARDEAIGEEERSAPSAAAAAASLGTTAVMKTPPPLLSSSRSAGPTSAAAGKKPRPGRRAGTAERRRRRDALRWAGVLVTVILLGLAGYFAVRIVKMGDGPREEPAEEPARAKPEPRRPREVQPLRFEPRPREEPPEER
jgi:hypothetical protein